jgi:5-methylcytosine-specific restriction protein A
MDEFPTARDSPFVNHPLANFIRQEIPRIFQENLPQYSNLIWHASPGISRWSDAPWIAAFDPLVTDTAQRGYYPVLLFTKSLDRVYLSLNQGMSELRQEFGGKETKEILSHRAKILRNRLSGSYENSFPLDHIDLEPPSPYSRLAMYEPGNAFSSVYFRNNLPSKNQIHSDLSAILDLYNLATIRGGTSEFDIGQPNPDPMQPDLSQLSMEEIRRYRYHRRIERNTKLAAEAKKIHGYVCQVCKFNFEERYGELGHEYIEAHHLTPLSDLPPGKPVQLSPRDDFAVLCSNCHRMIHRAGAPLEFSDFYNLYKVDG